MEIHTPQVPFSFAFTDSNPNVATYGSPYNGLSIRVRHFLNDTKLTTAAEQRGSGSITVDQSGHITA